MAAAGNSLPGSNAHLLPALASVSPSVNGDNNSPTSCRVKGIGKVPPRESP